MNKQELRQEYLARRRQLSDSEYEGLNQRLLEQFQNLDLLTVRCIHLFLPMRQNREPDTYLIRDWLRENHQGIKIVFPRSDFQTLQMDSYADDGDLVLAVNKYGITEPVAGNKVAAKDIDLVLLPMLVFDSAGYRVGYGKGFYDRFAKLCRPDVQLTGLSLFEPVQNIDDINGHDLRMQTCLTPGQPYYWPR